MKNGLKLKTIFISVQNFLKDMVRLMMSDYELINGDCLEVLPTLERETIDLVVTSPPYDNLRNYNKELEWNFDIFKQIANELYGVIKDGGVVVWIVNDATINGSETGTSFRQALYFKEIGFNLHDTMIYHKKSLTFPEINRLLSLLGIYVHSFKR